jgi:hypothetical protein
VDRYGLHRANGHASTAASAIRFRDMHFRFPAEGGPGDYRIGYATLNAPQA